MGHRLQDIYPLFSERRKSRTHKQHRRKGKRERKGRWTEVLSHPQYKKRKEQKKRKKWTHMTDKYHLHYSGEKKIIEEEGGKGRGKKKGKKEKKGIVQAILR